MESYVDVSKDNGGYDELTFIIKDAEDCLYTSHMQLPSLFNDSDQDEDMTFRLIKERRTRFKYNNLDDEKFQFYKFILSKSEEETSWIQELYEHSDLSKDFYVNFVNQRIENTLLMINKGVEFSGNAYHTHVIFTSEKRSTLSIFFLSRKIVKVEGRIWRKKSVLNINTYNPQKRRLPCTKETC